MKDHEIRDLPAPPKTPATPKRRPENPQEIRDLLGQDPAAVSDSELVALVAATGARKPGSRQGKTSWSSLELAAILLEESGGRLSDLVQAACTHAVDWRSYGVGRNIGARLIAAMELAERWRVGAGPSPAGTATAGDGGDLDAASLSLAVFEHRRTPSGVELVALVLGVKQPDLKVARQALAAFGSLREMIGTLTLDAFEPAYRRSHIFMRLTGTDLKIELAALCRLVAAVELARRYRGNKGTAPASLGLASENLEQLLDPATPLDRDLRSRLIEQLRSHPELTADFARLDRLTGDAGTDDYQLAAELHLMFDALCQPQGWTHPAEIVGEPVPFRFLLNIARAAIERSPEAPRVLQVKELLEAAERGAAARPVAAFVDALRLLSLSESGADQAFEEARRGYLAGCSATVDAGRRDGRV